MASELEIIESFESLTIDANSFQTILDHSGVSLEIWNEVFQLECDEKELINACELVLLRHAPDFSEKWLENVKAGTEEFWEPFERFARFVSSVSHRMFRPQDRHRDVMNALHSHDNILLRPLRARCMFQYPLYEYKPLKAEQIRVIEIISGPGEILRGRIKHTYDTTCDFTALSYEWGSPDPLFWIDIEEEDESEKLGHIPLSNNLYQALRDIQNSGKIDYLNLNFWIDQICIDQVNIVERETQVPMMGDIYENATDVLSYLGPQDPGDEMVFEYLEKWFSDSRVSEAHSKLAEQSFGGANSKEYVKEVLELEDDPKSAGLVESVSSSLRSMIWGPWTRRVWMVQETCLNEKLRFFRGTRIFDWTYIFTLALTTDALFSFQDTYPNIDAHMFVAGWCYCIRTIVKGRNWNYIMLLEMTPMHYLNSSLEVDRIFALYGLAKDFVGQHIKANYAQSYSEVLWDLSWVLIEHRVGLQVLASCRKEREDRFPDLPSWVVRDWGQSREVLTHYKACGGWMGDPYVTPDGHTLQVNGIKITNLRKVRPLFGSMSYRVIDGLYAKRTLNDLVAFKTLLREVEEYYQPYVHAESEIFLTFYTQRLSENETAEAPEYWRQALRRYKDALEAAIGHIQSVLDQRLNEDFRFNYFDLVQPIREELRQTVQEILWRRDKKGAMGFTDGHKICLLTNLAEKDDIVVALQGGYSLYVLRPEGDKKYSFVGTAQMYGYMNGEILGQPDWEQKVEEYCII